MLHKFLSPARFRESVGTLNLIRLSVCPSVTKTFTLAIILALLQIELLYLACVFFVTRPFRWYHVVTLTVTFHLLQGQICCRAGDHNSMNLLVITTLSDDRLHTVKCLFHISFLEKNEKAFLRLNPKDHTLYSTRK